MTRDLPTLLQAIAADVQPMLAEGRGRFLTLAGPKGVWASDRRVEGYVLALAGGRSE